MSPLIRALVPVKPLDEGKSRLAATLSPAGRHELNAWFLERALARVAEYPGPDRTTVVSRSATVLARARQLGMHALPEAAGDLNEAVLAGAQHALQAGADGLFIIPIDLPGGSGEDLRQMARLADSGPVCALVPDHHGRGTNLLFAAPVLMSGYAFGPGSLARHRMLAERAGLRTLVLRDSPFAFDVDEPDDYRRWRASPAPARTPVADTSLCPLIG